MGDKKEAVVQNENLATDSEYDSDASNDFALLKDYEKLLTSAFHIEMTNGDKIEELRKLLLKFGLPSVTSIGFERLCGLRSKIWKLVLGVPYTLNSFEYMDKIKVTSNYNLLYSFLNLIFHLFSRKVQIISIAKFEMILSEPLKEMKSFGNEWMKIV